MTVSMKRAKALSRLAEQDADEIEYRLTGTIYVHENGEIEFLTPIGLEPVVWPPPPYDTAIKRKEQAMKKKPMPMKKGKPGKKYGC